MFWWLLFYSFGYVSHLISISLLTSTHLWCSFLFFGHQFNAFQVKGLKKLENYLRKEEEKLLIRNSACPEDVEFAEIQLEIEKNLYTSHLKCVHAYSNCNFLMILCLLTIF